MQVILKVDWYPDKIDPSQYEPGCLAISLQDPNTREHFAWAISADQIQHLLLRRSHKSILLLNLSGVYPRCTEDGPQKEK